MSYYKHIYGQRYDNNLITLSSNLIKGQGDGRLSLNDVESLITHVHDKKLITNIEIDTLKYIYRQHKLSDIAKIRFLEFIVFLE